MPVSGVHISHSNVCSFNLQRNTLRCNCAVQLANRVQTMQGLLASMVSLIPEYSTAFTEIIWPAGDDDSRSLFAALRYAGAGFMDGVAVAAVPAARLWLQSDGPTASHLPFCMRSVWMLTELKVRRPLSVFSIRVDRLS